MPTLDEPSCCQDMMTKIVEQRFDVQIFLLRFENQEDKDSMSKIFAQIRKPNIAKIRWTIYKSGFDGTILLSKVCQIRWTI